MSKPVKTKVAANVLADTSSSFAIIGTYEGEALDTNITNNNGLDITREVMEVVFASEDYKSGIENGWFIGFLGHPKDPNCMDFRNACIVMTEGHIDENGKVQAKFNLVDTPVGRVVKTFQDAGVRFGISIRGAGDIINNSVDPDTFVFRGFDLVAFPAYPESIPTFTAIAASTNLSDRQKYKAVCAAIKTNLDSIQSSETLEVIKSQFAPQSDEYAMIENRANELDTDIVDDIENIDSQKVEAMTQLYLEAIKANKQLAAQLETCKREYASVVASTNKKLASMKRVTSAQLDDALSAVDAQSAESKKLSKQNKVLGSRLKTFKESNLIYQQKVESSKKELAQKDRIIASLESKLSKTVTASQKIEASVSNLDKKNNGLEARLSKCEENLKSFQDAYVNMYANALGVNPGELSITSNTTVEEVHDLVSSAINTSGLPASADMMEPIFVDDDDDNIITM